jgi:hypothetical protein
MPASDPQETLDVHCGNGFHARFEPYQSTRLSRYTAGPGLGCGYAATRIHVANVTHPGGNLTGFSMYEFSIGGKWIDLLKEIAPNLARLAALFNPDPSPQSRQRFLRNRMQGAALRLRGHTQSTS